MMRHKANSVSTEKISSRVLYVLIGVVAVVFALFYLVGFGTPYLPEPSFNAPMFTDAVLWLMALLLLLAAVVAVLAVIKTVRKTGKGDAVSNGIPVRRIAIAIISLTVALLVGSCLLASTSPMIINGRPYDDHLWLRLADMFIYTSLALMVVAVLAVAFGASRSYRKGRR